MSQEESEYDIVGKECPSDESHLMNIAGRECYYQVYKSFLNYKFDSGFTGLPAKSQSRRIKFLEESVYRMSDSILNDPIKPKMIEDLGLSQTYRLFNFLNSSRTLPEVSLEIFKGKKLPIIGAEFHLTKKFEGLYENIFNLNMAQYHPNSSIPLSGNDHFSGNDEKIIEIRTNPSYYPVTIANWNLMKNFVPLDETYYNLTITPLPKNNKKLNQLKSLMNLIYADKYNSAIEKEQEQKIVKKEPIYYGNPDFVEKISINSLALFEIANVAGHIWKIVDDGFRWWHILTFPTGGILGLGAALSLSIALSVIFRKPVYQDSFSFGKHYIGQTQNLKMGKFEQISDHLGIDAKIPGKRYPGKDCQLNLYCGFGDIFPKQAYYASMAYIDSEILEIVGREAGDNIGLKKAVEMPKKDIEYVLNTINKHIVNDKELAKITKSGMEIMKKFVD